MMRTRLLVVLACLLAWTSAAKDGEASTSAPLSDEWSASSSTSRPGRAASKALFKYVHGENPSVSMQFVPSSPYDATTGLLAPIYGKIHDHVVLGDGADLSPDLLDRFHFVHASCRYNDDRYVLHWYRTPEPPVTWLATTLDQYLLYPSLVALHQVVFRNNEIKALLPKVVEAIAASVAARSAGATLQTCTAFLYGQSRLLQQLLPESERNANSAGISELQVELDPGSVARAVRDLTPQKRDQFNCEVGAAVAARLLQDADLGDDIRRVLRCVLPDVLDVDVTTVPPRPRSGPAQFLSMFCAQKKLLLVQYSTKAQDVDDADVRQIVRALEETLKSAPWDSICLSYLHHHESILSSVPHDAQSASPFNMIMPVLP